LFIHSFEEQQQLKSAISVTLLLILSGLHRDNELMAAFDLAFALSDQ
jgi:hypothetical protein